MFPKQDFGKSVNKFYVLKNSKWQYKNADSLKEITLGTILGYVYAGEIKFLTKNSKKVTPTGGENGFERNYEKLLRNEIDATIEESTVAAFTMKQLKINEKVIPSSAAS